MYNLDDHYYLRCQTACHECNCDFNNFECTECMEIITLLEAGSNAMTEYGWGVFHNIRHGKKGLVKYLIENKLIDINHVDKEDNSSLLIRACIHNQKEIAEYLILSGCDLNICETNYGYTALDFAFEMDELSIITLLLENGAQSSSREEYDNEYDDFIESRHDYDY